MGYPFGQLWSAVVVVSAPKLLPTPSLLTAGAVRNKAGLDAVQALLSNS